MLLLRFFSNGSQIFAIDCELEPTIASTCQIKNKMYTVDSVSYVYDVKGSFLRLDVTEQQESKD